MCTLVCAVYFKYVQFIICQLNLSKLAVTCEPNLAYDLQGKNGFYILKVITKEYLMHLKWSHEV